MIVYMKCACRSRDKILAKRLRDEGQEVRVVRGNPSWRKEVAKYGLKLPIAVENGKARRLWT